MRSIFLLAVFTFALTAARPGLADQGFLHGQFVGASGHAASGAAIIEKSTGGTVIVLGEDFKFDGGPDPKVGFGRDGVYDKSTTIEALKSNSGRQEYRVPNSTDPAKYNEVYIWCERYAVPLAVAKMK